MEASKKDKVVVSEEGMVISAELGDLSQSAQEHLRQFLPEGTSKTVQVAIVEGDEDCKKPVVVHFRGRGSLLVWAQVDLELHTQEDEKMNYMKIGEIGYLGPDEEP